MRTIPMVGLFLATFTAMARAQDREPERPIPPAGNPSVIVKKYADYDEAEKRAYRQGAVEAEQQIKEGNATIAFNGLGFGNENLDRETGLFYKGIAACVTDSEDEARMRGHNDRIKQHIKDRGLPAYSLKKWEREIFDLSGFCEARAKDARPQRLVLGGQAHKSPDGHATLQFARRKFEGLDGEWVEGVFLVTRIDDMEREPLLITGEFDRAEIVWGSKDAPFAVLRIQRGQGPYDTAIDLRTGKMIRRSGR